MQLDAPSLQCLDHKSKENYFAGSTFR